MKNIVGFMHIYTVNHYEEIVQSQVQQILDSGLVQFVDKVYYVVIGEEFEIENSHFVLLEYNSDMSLHENYTLNRIRTIAKASKKNFPIFYIHTKGVTKPKDKCLRDWRQYMEYYCIGKWLHCLDALNVADTVGVSLRRYGKIRYHYSGNFWWANSSYIKQLPELSEEGYGREVNRWDGEFWIGDGSPKMMQMHNSRVHHATQQYPLRRYENRLDMRLWGR